MPLFCFGSNVINAVQTKQKEATAQYLRRVICLVDKWNGYEPPGQVFRQIGRMTTVSIWTVCKNTAMGKVRKTNTKRDRGKAVYRH